MRRLHSSRFVQLFQSLIGHLNAEVSPMRLPVAEDSRAAVMISSTCSACSGGRERIGDRLLAPNMFSCGQSLSINALVLLHIRQIHQELKGFAR